ncbi:MAG: hypothetical protein P4M15_03850 [Alphaproteobacteria bacterium]|nr:hypothetical protein [Alphaproteobacteria bacterium]
MSTPSNKQADFTDPSSLVRAVEVSTSTIEYFDNRQIENSVQTVSLNASAKCLDKEIFPLGPSYEPPETFPVIGSRSPKTNWWRPTLIFAFAAGLVYIVVDDPSLPWDRTGSLSLAQSKGDPANHQVASLIINDAPPSPVDQPVPLGVSVDGANELNFLVISGLPKGAALSAGHFVGDDGWSLYATEIKDALIQPPPHFVGVMELTVSLIIGANTIESRPMQFEWVAETAPEMQVPEQRPTEAKAPDEAPPIVKVQDEAAPAAKAPDETPPVAKAHDEAPPAAKALDPAPPVARLQDVAPPVAKPPDAPPPVAKSKSPAIRPLSPEETAALLKRGSDLISSGDLAAARLVLQRAAEAGNARAAFTLAGTYNPITLEKLQVHGLSPDPAIARHWYEKARELGSPEAARELQLLTVKQN